MEIKVGDKVRSFDFPHSREYWFEGVVEGFERIEGCDRYKIKVDREFRKGKEVDIHPEQPPHIFPPVNGTRRMLGGVTSGVELV